MGANDKLDATLHGSTPDTQIVEHAYVAYRSSKVYLVAAHHEFTRWLEQVRAEAKAEALNEAASKLEDASVSPIWCWDKCGDPKCPDDIRVGAATEIQRWLRARANQYKEEQ